MALLQATLEALSGVQTEIAIFLVAVCAHALIFGSHRIKEVPFKPRQAGAQTGSSKGSSAGSSPHPLAASLARAAKQLLRQGADRSRIAQSFEEDLEASSHEGVCDALAGMLEQLGRGANAEILAAVRMVLSEHSLTPTMRLSELLMRSYFGMCLKNEFKELLSEAESRKDITPGIAVLAMKASLSALDLEAALHYLRHLAPQMTTDRGSTDVSPSVAPKQLMQQLVQLAVQKGNVMTLLKEFRDSGLLSTSTLEDVLVECTKGGDASVLQQAEAFARSEGMRLSDAAYSALLRSAGSAEGALCLFKEAAEQNLVGKSLLLAALDRATSHGEAALGTLASQHFNASSEPEPAAALVRFTASARPAGKDRDTAVLDVYARCMTKVDVLTDARAGRTIAEAAFRGSRLDLLAQLLGATQEVSRQVALLRSFGSERRLDYATEIFKACPAKTVNLYNALLSTCIDCHDLEAAERVMADALKAGMADVVTYNTMIKKHLLRGDFGGARAAIESMRAAGGSLAPNCVTFNELIDATIRTSSEGAWVLIEEMKASGLQPNNVTCSILLKSVQQSSNAREVERVMAVVDDMDDAMDEVLLSSICEACIRVGQADALRRQLKRHRHDRRVQANGAHTFGSLVRAYGFLKDMHGAWEEWREMRTRSIVPTSITIGCMVEALVSNGDPEAGHGLIRDLIVDEQTKPLLNAVIYCSVLKGFSHQKRFDRVWAIYDEMLELRLQFSITTFNALIDACVRSRQMDRIRPLLEDMARQKIEANVVTYSTIMKGYCQENRLDKALELMEAMKQSEQFRPDEITYNTLIDGCAQRGFFEQGMKLLGEMQEAGVPPSTFTLSVLVKLANRSKQPEKAFELCERLSRKFHLRMNMHVYNNLVHACTANRDTQRAIKVFEQMLRENVRPDVRTYSLLLRGCLGTGDAQDVAGLLRAAVGLRGAHPRVASFGASALQVRGGLPAELLSEVLEGLAGSCGEERLAVQLLRDLRSHQGVKLDPKLSLSLTSRTIGSRSGF